MNGLYTLVVVAADGPELFVKFGQADEKIVRVAVAHRDAKRSVEEVCTDKIRRTAVLCPPHHRQESFVFLVVERDVIPVCSRVGKNGVAFLVSQFRTFSHIAYIKIRLGRICLPHAFCCGHLSAGESRFAR